ncbi:MAG: exodeoxyribonuclease V subunit alpha [Candidatus Endonucleobacter bathymodioli]|uniref:RecBCD enzyme subunit RecD n=1 Tax=Candidatus Endonucleibacter bathymodioli TaxID=539814 RepID=A0AA90NZZ0_9GAMM|nr:exodeoxyribonuclease V subunit alpha [Candidatus Endonucleobacter bathymodioli]
MLELLKGLVQNNQIKPLDYQFARFIYSLHNDDVLALVSAMVSHQLGLGNVCLSLETIDPNCLFNQNQKKSQAIIEAAQCDVCHWHEHLLKQPWVGDGCTPTPLVIEKKRLYLYRYWQYEKQVAAFLGQNSSINVDHQAASLILNRLFRRDYTSIYQQCHHLESGTDIQKALVKWLDIEHQNSLDWSAIQQCILNAKTSADLSPLDKLVPDKYCLNWQKIAVALASTQSFSIISGGPGTGKTTTVTKLLALLVELGIQSGSPPNIKLVAPTGKASARLTESIGGALNKLACNQQVKDLIPTNARTIHRLLGVMPYSNGFRHNNSNKLHLDILVVDEASMIDLPMMARLLEAMPNNGRLILLGDRDQLASVEAGSVLGDICTAADGGYSTKQIQIMEQMTGFNLNEYSNSEARPINNSICLLQKSYRFDALSGIGLLANAINTGNQKAITRTLSLNFKDIDIHPTDSYGYHQLLKLCTTEYQRFLAIIKTGIIGTESETIWHKKILQTFHSFQLLCALREGQFGVNCLNEVIRLALSKANLIDEAGLWYRGRPVLITKNDHDLNLYNGDIGIALNNNDSRLRVIFELPDGSIKQFLPSRLPEHETVFAMTIHKSQGSEFEHAAIALPNQFNPMITRELVYTGITRAKKKLDLFCSADLLNKAIKTPTQRISGLKERL